ncbi:hypothetical protein A6P54_18140 [Bacillus sp. MKU004]|nr:hypothetical protein A6P54_18140 [Bacillus sp. MKU004]
MGYSIRKIIEKISSGEVRIPAFQRGFVWEPENVAFLMDSLYKDFPFGTILLWRTREQLKTERQLGNFKLPLPQKDYPIDYVLDGQQRLTSIFTVFQTDLEGEENESWMDIYYILDNRGSIQDSRFIALEKKDFDPDKYFPLNVLFDSVRYRQATEGLEPEVIKEIDKLQEKFKEVDVPIELMETDNKEHVAIVFERINRAGIPLDSFQLLSAWSWSTDFDLQEELSQLSDELSGYGFGELASEQDLLLKSFTGFIVGETTPKSIVSLDGQKVRENFEVIKSGIMSSIDFLQKELNLYSLKLVPYPSMIVSLTKFFGTNKKNGRLYTDKQRRELIRWFWRNCFSRRYSSGVNTAHEEDLAGMEKLQKDENHSISNFKCEVETGFFLQNQFSINSVNTKTFITMLASNYPKSFISGANVNLADVLKKASGKEFHHIFPVKHLQRLGKTKKEIYPLVNFCFLNNADNQIIKDKDPKKYQNLINQESLDEILSSALCPNNTFDVNYDDFKKERAKILVKYAKELIS